MAKKNGSSYGSLFFSVKDSSSRRRISNVEGVVFGSDFRVIPSLNDEGVFFATFHYQLRDEDIIDVPGNAPPCHT